MRRKSMSVQHAPHWDRWVNWLNREEKASLFFLNSMLSILARITFNKVLPKDAFQVTSSRRSHSGSFSKPLCFIGSENTLRTEQEEFQRVSLSPKSCEMEISRISLRSWTLRRSSES